MCVRGATDKHFLTIFFFWFRVHVLLDMREEVGLGIYIFILWADFSLYFQAGFRYSFCSGDNQDVHAILGYFFPAIMLM